MHSQIGGMSSRYLEMWFRSCLMSSHILLKHRETIWILIALTMVACIINLKFLNIDILLSFSLPEEMLWGQELFFILYLKLWVCIAHLVHYSCGIMNPERLKKDILENTLNMKEATVLKVLCISALQNMLVRDQISGVNSLLPPCWDKFASVSATRHITSHLACLPSHFKNAGATAGWCCVEHLCMSSGHPTQFVRTVRQAFSILS